MSRYLATPLGRIALPAFTLAVALSLTGSVAYADPSRPTAVGSDGELFVLRGGAYGDLFPEQGLADPANPALALDQTVSGGDTERFLVPGTETADTEDNASVLFEGESGTLFILWQTKVNVIHSRFNLVGFRNGEWTEGVEISGNPYGWKSPPQLAVARDTFRTRQDDGSLRTWKRTVVHLLWWEDNPSGHPVPYYSPVTFIDGEYTGWNPVHRLDALLPEEISRTGETSNPGSAVVAKALTIREGRDAQSAAVGFVDPVSGRLVSLVLELIPGEITFIADEIRAQIDEFGRDLWPDQPEALAAKTRTRVHELGTDLGLHPALTRYLADQAHGDLSGADPSEPLNAIADRIRAQIDEFGARITDAGLDRMAEKSTTIPRFVDLPAAPSSSVEGDRSIVPNKLQLLVASIRSVPVTGREGVSLHLAPNAREALISWLGEDVVHYRESRKEGWSPPRALRLGSDLDLDGAREILEQRAHQRGIE